MRGYLSLPLPLCGLLGGAGAVALSVALSSLTPTAAQARTETLRTECYGNRCVVYNRHGERLGTLTEEPGGRVSVRDKKGRLQSKITPLPAGRVRVERQRGR